MCNGGNMKDSKAWDIVVVGGANMNYMVRCSKLPTPGNLVEGKDFHELAGGKGVNQAAVAARLGARVALVACIGTDQHAKAVLQHLSNEGVESHYVVHNPEQQTGVVLVQIDERGQKQIISAPGAMNLLSVEDVERASDALKSAKTLLMQLEVPVKTITLAAQIARSAQAKVFLDSSPPQTLPDSLLVLVDVIKANAKEAQVLTGIEVRDRNSARKAAKQLLERGVGTVAIQAGEEEDLLVWHGGELWLPRFDAKSIDTTSYSDVFIVALAIAMLEECSLQEAGQFASAAAALATTNFGVYASVLRRMAIQNLLADFKACA